MEAWLSSPVDANAQTKTGRVGALREPRHLLRCRPRVATVTPNQDRATLEVCERFPQRAAALLRRLDD
jgi:hypothetical protein